MKSVCASRQILSAIFHFSNVGSSKKWPSAGTGSRPCPSGLPTLSQRKETAEDPSARKTRKILIHSSLCRLPVSAGACQPRHTKRLKSHPSPVRFKETSSDYRSSIHRFPRYKTPAKLFARRHHVSQKVPTERGNSTILRHSVETFRDQ